MTSQGGLPHGRCNHCRAEGQLLIACKFCHDYFCRSCDDNSMCPLCAVARRRADSQRMVFDPVGPLPPAKANGATNHHNNNGTLPQALPRPPATPPAEQRNGVPSPTQLQQQHPSTYPQQQPVGQWHQAPAPSQAPQVVGGQHRGSVPPPPPAGPPPPAYSQSSAHPAAFLSNNSVPASAAAQEPVSPSQSTNSALSAVLDNQQPFIDVPSQLPTSVCTRMANLHMQLGDFGELILTGRESCTGRVIAANSEAVRIQPEDSAAVPLSLSFVRIQLFVRDESKSRPIVEAASSPTANAQQRPIEVLDMIGSGAQGRVSKARYRDAPHGEFIVVKEIMFPSRDVRKVDEAEAKSREIMNLRHEHLVQYLEVRRVNATTLWVIMPLYEERDMVHFLGTLTRPLTEYHLCSLILQLAGALDFLHSSRPPRIHRDVKLDNVLMFDNGKRTLLVDLDLSRSMPTDKRSAVTLCGTFEYMAPEAEQGQLGPPADVWALGIILFILLAMPEWLLIPHPRTGEKLPFSSPHWDQATLWNTIQMFIEESCRARRARYSRKLVDLTCAMMNRDPTKRPTAARVSESLKDIMVSALTAA